MTSKLQMKTVMLSSLIEDKGNANQMNAETLKQLSTNIKELGFWQPILVAAEGNYFKIVDGHHRAKAAKAAGLQSVPAILWDGTEAMRKGFAVSMNKLRGELDLNAVQKVLAEMADGETSTFDMTFTGYSEDEVNELLSLTREVTDDEAIEKGTPTPNRAKKADAGEGAEPGDNVMLTLELVFQTKADLLYAKKRCKLAAGKNGSLTAGLLAILHESED